MMNDLDPYKLTPPSSLYPLNDETYPDITPFIHTNPKINNIYLNNFVNGYTNSDLLSKNPLNIKQQKDYKFTTNSNTNGNNTSTTSLGENEVGIKLFNDVNIDNILDSMLKNLNQIKKFRLNKVNNDKIMSSYANNDYDINKLNNIIMNDEPFIDNTIVNIIMNNDINWTEYCTNMIDKIFTITNTKLFNHTFQKYWKFLKLIIFNFDNKLMIFEFINKWLLNYINTFEVVFTINNVKILNDKLPILQFIIIELLIKIIPDGYFTFNDIDFINLVHSIINLQYKYDDDLNIINNIVINLFNIRNIQNFKILDEESVASEVDYQALSIRCTEWKDIVKYLQQYTQQVDNDKLNELIIWNYGIALKYLNDLDNKIIYSTDITIIDHGIALSPDSKIILTKEYNHKNILSHNILYLINNCDKNFIPLIENYKMFEEEAYWILIISYFLKTKSDINLGNLIILTNHLINMDLINVNNFFLKMISSGILHNEYREKVGHFLMNINYWNNNVKLYDTILSKYFSASYNDYSTEAVRAKIESGEKCNNHLISTQQSFKYLLFLKNNTQFVTCEDLIKVHDTFIYTYSYQYVHFWNFINFLLNNNLITQFKVFKLALNYILIYAPDAELFDINFDVIFNYYMKLEQSMILKDVEYSNNHNMVLKYHFDGDVNTQKVLIQDYSIYDYAKIWNNLNSIYNNPTLAKLIDYESLKHNTILNYNILYEHVPSNIEMIKDEVNNHGILQQFLIKAFRQYFNDSSSLVNIMIIKLKFLKTFNNFIPYFLKRLKLDSNNEIYLKKLIMLIDDDVVGIDILFNRLPIEDMISIVNIKDVVIYKKILNWIEGNQNVVVKLLSNKLLTNDIKLVIINKFYSPAIESYLINEKELLCDMLGINYQQDYLSLNESNIIKLINNLNLCNYHLMKLLFNELINNLKINEILSILQSLNYDYILLNFLIIDFSSIEDYGKLLLNQLLSTILNNPNPLLLDLININIKNNKKLILKNFKISNDNIKIIINKLSLIKKSGDNNDDDLKNVFIIMLLFNITDIKLNVNNNSKMSKHNQILASLINDKFDLYNDKKGLVKRDLGVVDKDESLDIVRLRQNML